MLETGGEWKWVTYEFFTTEERGMSKSKKCPSYSYSMLLPCSVTPLLITPGMGGWASEGVGPSAGGS